MLHILAISVTNIILRFNIIKSTLELKQQHQQQNTFSMKNVHRTMKQNRPMEAY